MLVNRRLAQVALVVDPEHVVAIEHAPERTKRVAEAEVDAAHRFAQRRRPLILRALLFEIRIHQAFECLEAAQVFLPYPRLAHRRASLAR